MANEILIANLVAREVLDSRGLPTIEVAVYLNNQAMTSTSIATIGDSQASLLAFSRQPAANSSEAQPIGLSTAVNFINQDLGPKLVGQNPINQEQLDEIIVKTISTHQEFSGLNVKVSMVLSQAMIKAAAISYGWPIYYYIWRRYQLNPAMNLPTCLFGMFNGGSRGEDNMNFHETQIIPARAIPFSQALQSAVLTYQSLKNILIAKGGGQATSILGGFIPILPRNIDALDLLVEAIRSGGFVMGRDLFFGVDLESTHYFSLGKYKIKDSAAPLNSSQMLDYLKRLHTSYGVYLFEDPFDGNDASSWKKFQGEMGDAIRLVADKFSNQNNKEVKEAISQKYCNTFTLKPAQTESISSLIETLKLIRQSGLQVVLGHKEGETVDDFIADLAVGLGTDYCKFGPPNRGERIIKYNRLLAIESEINQIKAANAAATAV